MQCINILLNKILQKRDYKYMMQKKILILLVIMCLFTFFSFGDELAKTSRQGSSLEIYGLFHIPVNGEYFSTGVYLGSGIGWIYQFNNWFSLGVNTSYLIGMKNFIPINKYTQFDSFSDLAVKFVFGNKVDGFAFSLEGGVILYGKQTVTPMVRFGLYIKNWFVLATGWPLFSDLVSYESDSYAANVHGAIGYSFYFGE
jgi:hypothetical protein